MPFRLSLRGRRGKAGGNVLDYWQLTLATGVYLGSVILAICGVIVAVLAIRIHGRATAHLVEFVHLREDLKELSDGVKQLLVAEERRFLKELKSFKIKEEEPRKDAELGSAAGASGSHVPHSAVA
jgi:hypothetical protein